MYHGFLAKIKYFGKTDAKIWSIFYHIFVSENYFKFILKYCKNITIHEIKNLKVLVTDFYIKYGLKYHNHIFLEKNISFFSIYDRYKKYNNYGFQNSEI